jgi:hypothetical protein
MTVTITLTIAEADTGNFSIFSNLDLNNPLITGVSRSQLLTGYSVANVPDAATSLIVKSNSAHCTNDITIPIQGITTSTTTTTTTTQACLQVRYGYDPYSPYEACNNYYAASSFYYFNGQTLYDGPGCSGALADSGYYSDGADAYQWDSTQPGNGFSAPSIPCDDSRKIRVYTRINVPYTPGTPIQSIKVVYSANEGGTWNYMGQDPNPNSPYNITSPSYNNFSTIENSSGEPEYINVNVGTNLWIVVVPNTWSSPLQGGGINFAAATSLANTGCIGTVANPPVFSSDGRYPYCYAGNYTIPQLNTNCSNLQPGFNEGIYNYGVVTKDDDIYILLNAEISGQITSYRGCSN